MSPETEDLVMAALEVFAKDCIARAEKANANMSVAADQVHLATKSVEAARVTLTTAENTLAQATRVSAEVTAVYVKLERQKAAALRLVQEGLD